MVSRSRSSGGEEHIGEWDDIWRKKERKNKKKIRVSLSDVLSGLGRTEIKFKGLDFQAYVDSLSSSAASAMGNRVQYTRFIH